MTLPELCIRRPVFATVLSLILVLIGLMAFSRLTIREYPNIDEPQVGILSERAVEHRGAERALGRQEVPRALPACDEQLIRFRGHLECVDENHRARRGAAHDNWPRSRLRLPRSVLPRRAVTPVGVPPLRGRSL